MKLVKIIPALVTIMLAACSNQLETKLLGSWTLQECEILKLDSLCKVRAAEDVASTNKAIELLHHQLDSTKAGDQRNELLEEEKKLKADLENCTPQSIKDEYTELYKNQIGALTITFSENKQIQIKVAGADEQFGTWRVNGDTVTTMFDNQPAEILIVKAVTSNSLQLYSPALDERSVDLVMKMGKK